MLKAAPMRPCSAGPKGYLPTEFIRTQCFLGVSILRCLPVPLSPQSLVMLPTQADEEGGMGRWKSAPDDIQWTADKVSEIAEQSAKKATLDCVEQAMNWARSYEAADNQKAAEALRKFAEGLMR